MSEKPRRWFQIHLSTAVVLMVVAGALLGLNISNAGWPIQIEYWGSLRNHPQLRGIVLDICLNIEILLGVPALLEYLIRRREARNR